MYVCVHQGVMLALFAALLVSAVADTAPSAADAQADARNAVLGGMRRFRTF